MKKLLHLSTNRILLVYFLFGFYFSSYGQATAITTWAITPPATTPAWDNGLPNETTDAVIAAPLTTIGEANIYAYSLSITNNATVNISSGNTVRLSGALTVDSGSSITFNDNANLIQEGTTNLNSGNIIMKRNSSLLKRLDYTLWSSPVTGSQTLLNFSPLTLTNRFYKFTTYEDIVPPATTSSTNQYTVVDPSTTTFAMAQGYLIRMPNNHPSTNATSWEGNFTGVPNSGDYSFTMVDGGVGNRFNLVGNPYPSPIDAASFVAANSDNITGTLYFWRKTNNALSPSYCSWSSLGFASNGEAEVYDLNGVIQTGQGFFVEGSGNGNTLIFNNSMRTNDHSDQFFKNSNVTNTVESHRIWLNATSSNGSFSQLLIGYCTNATQGYDSGIDGKFINDGDISLTTLIGTNRYAIQGRALPFTTSDVVPLSFKATNAGTYTIAIDHVDGLFAGNAQDIFIRDNLDGSLHNLNNASYTFVSEAGTFANRFELVYQNMLSVPNSSFTPNSIVIYNQEHTLILNSGSTMMATVRIFDISGRVLFEKTGINASETRINVGVANQVLLAEVTTIEGLKATKKIAN
ncbi:hypothetical protein [Flavobacterium sp. N1994]|uniref:hypothetical protein n=1 Tax=Flavobacterium sp. N1994 TaxID=2986827 RepID=UPI002221AB5A|nr:hypothetical protein [Flavobacterium sp. N1994]